MVFKFFKEMVDAVKSGIEEGKAELADEQKQRDITAIDDEHEFLKAVGKEMFLVGLGAPYRHFFLTEDPRTVGTFYLADKQKAEATKLLQRDFGVNDNSSAIGGSIVIKTLIYALLVSDQEEASLSDDIDVIMRASNRMEVVKAIIDETEQGVNQKGADVGAMIAQQTERMISVKQMLEPGFMEHTEIATCASVVNNVARLSYFVSVSAGLGYLSKEEAITILEPAGKLVGAFFNSWESYAEAFKAGETMSKLNNALGKKLLIGAAEKLLKMENGPWQVQPWIIPESPL
jgi:hypothetical protein